MGSLEADGTVVTSLPVGMMAVVEWGEAQCGLTCDSSALVGRAQVTAEGNLTLCQASSSSVTNSDAQGRVIRQEMTSHS